MTRPAFGVLALLTALACGNSPAQTSNATGGSTSALTGGGPPSSGGQGGAVAQGGTVTTTGGSAVGGSQAGTATAAGGSAGSAAGGAAGSAVLGTGGTSAGTSSTGGAPAGGTATNAGNGGTATGGGGASGGSSQAGGGGGAGSGGGSATGGAGASNGGSAGATQCPMVSDFATWPTGKSPTEIGQRVVINYLARATAAYHYADACAWYGALGFTKITGDETRRQQLIGKYDQFLTGAGYYPQSGTTVDDRVGGIVPLELFIQTQDTSKAYLTIGLKPANSEYGEMNANLSSLRYWIDDMFMVTALQVQASRASKDVKYRDIAAKAMLSYFTALQQTNGLFFHTRTSQVHWGRGNGWVAVGMAELLLDLPAGTTRDQVMAGYKKMMAALKTLQIPDGQDGAGLWRQVLDYDQAWFETSGSAMFTYSIATGVRNGWLPADYAPTARRGWLAVTGQLDASANLQNTCVGTGAAPAGTATSQRDFYLGRPKSTGDLHGQAPVLWTANTLLRDYRCGG